MGSRRSALTYRSLVAHRDGFHLCMPHMHTCMVCAVLMQYQDLVASSHTLQHPNEMSCCVYSQHLGICAFLSCLKPCNSIHFAYQHGSRYAQGTASWHAGALSLPQSSLCFGSTAEPSTPAPTNVQPVHPHPPPSPPPSTPLITPSKPLHPPRHNPPMLSQAPAPVD